MGIDYYTFFLIFVLYVKICILVRSRIGEQPGPQQFRNMNREEGGNTANVFSGRTKNIMFRNQALDDRGTSDGVSCEFVDLQVIEETHSSSQNNEVPPHSSIYIVSGSNPISSPPQSERKSEFSHDQQIPGPSATTWYQLPGTVKDQSDIDRSSQSPLPKVHNTTLHDSCDSQKDEPVIPDLNNQNENNGIITRRVTLMLFVVTLVFFVTHVIASMMLFLPHGIVRHFFRDFLLINHAINPVIYNIANGGFRASCINFVHGIREKFGLWTSETEKIGKREHSDVKPSSITQWVRSCLEVVSPIPCNFVFMWKYWISLKFH